MTNTKKLQMVYDILINTEMSAEAMVAEIGEIIGERPTDQQPQKGNNKMSEKTTIWTVTEAYQDVYSDEDISGYTVLAATENDAQTELQRLITERVEDFYSGNDDTPESISAKIDRILNTHDGNGWYRWITDNAHYSWNVAIKDLPAAK